MNFQWASKNALGAILPYQLYSKNVENTKVEISDFKVGWKNLVADATRFFNV